MANIIAELGLGIIINSTNSHEFRRWLDMPLDFIPHKGNKRNKSQFKNIAWDLAIFLHIQGSERQEDLWKQLGGSTDQRKWELLCIHKGHIKFQKFGIRVWEDLRWCNWGFAHWKRHEQDFERLEMTRSLRVIQQTQEKDFEKECQERITAQKLITQFWGCYNI